MMIILACFESYENYSLINGIHVKGKNELACVLADPYVTRLHSANEHSSSFLHSSA